MSLANANGGLQPQHKAPLSLSVSAQQCTSRFVPFVYGYFVILNFRNYRMYLHGCLGILFFFFLKDSAWTLYWIQFEEKIYFLIFLFN